MVPSVGFIHLSDPNAGILSPNPGDREIESNFLGGGVTLEFANTDVHMWLGVKQHNATWAGGDKIGPGGAIVVSHKLRRSGWQ